MRLSCCCLPTTSCCMEVVRYIGPPLLGAGGVGTICTASFVCSNGPTTYKLYLLIRPHAIYVSLSSLQMWNCRYLEEPENTLLKYKEDDSKYGMC